MRPKKDRNRDVFEEGNPQDKNYKLKVRKLHYLNDEEHNWSAHNGTTHTGHKIRHKKKLRKHNERHSDRRHTNESIHYRNDPFRATPILPRNLEFGLAGNQSLTFKSNDRIMNLTDDIGRDKTHDHCYSTNEVLEIIAVTCLVNFIFWFLIITCVNYLTRKERVRYPSWESMNSIEIPSEYEELRLHHERNNYSHRLKRSLTGSDFVDEGFGNFLLGDDEGPYIFNDQEENGSDWGILRDEGYHFHHWTNRRRFSRYNIPTSYSMENLLF